MTDLAAVQRWMQTVITDSAGVSAGLATAAQTADEMVAPSSSLSGFERLTIYSHSYHARLLACLRSVFPSLRQALGDELFDDFVLDYLRVHPPGGYTLDRSAAGFSRYLAETRPDHDVAADRREDWPGFIIDLAVLETAVVEVYDGPGLEGRTSSSSDPDLATISTDDDVLAMCPSPAPCLRLYAMRYPVHIYLLATRRGETPALPSPGRSLVAVTRQHYRVRIREVPAQEYAVLSVLDGRRPLGEALDAASGNGQPPSPAQVREWLGEWTARGFIEPPPSLSQPAIQRRRPPEVSSAGTTGV